MIKVAILYFEKEVISKAQTFQAILQYNQIQNDLKIWSQIKKTFYGIKSI